MNHHARPRGVYDVDRRGRRRMQGIVMEVRTDGMACVMTAEAGDVWVTSRGKRVGDDASLVRVDTASGSWWQVEDDNGS